MGRAELGGPSPPGKYPKPHLGEIALVVTVDIGNRPSPVGSETRMIHGFVAAVEAPWVPSRAWSATWFRAETQ